MNKMENEKRNKETYNLCGNCRTEKPCILNCPYKWEIIEGKHYIKK